MKKQLDKRFLFKEIENELVSEWNNKKIFKFESSNKKKPFVL